jgi:Protein of unknown function (DUF2914)
MRTAISCLALLLVAGTVSAAAGETPAATAAVCTAIENNACEGATLRFPANVGKLWGFSQVSHVPDKIVHVWFFRDRELGHVDLPVKADHWRTWSNITVSSNMTGPWRLEVRDANGKLLASYKFTIE